MTPADIRALRRRLGLTQAAFAVRVGVPVTTVSRWENGAAVPRTVAVRRAFATLANGPVAESAANGCTPPRL
jgi:DNA-binding transcriptional regulator YiaG